MKNLLSIILLSTLIISCDEETPKEAPNPKTINKYADLNRITGIKPHIAFTTISASWGLNCHGQVAKSDVGLLTNTGKYHNIQKDNILEKVRMICEDESGCYFDPRYLGNKPAPNCNNDITITYRCYSYDNEHSKTFTDGQIVDINCKQN